MTCILSSRHIYFCQHWSWSLLYLLIFNDYPGSSIVCMLQIRCLTFNLESYHLSTLWCLYTQKIYSKQYVQNYSHRSLQQTIFVCCCVLNQWPYQSYLHANLSKIAANGYWIGEWKTMPKLLSGCKLWHYGLQLWKYSFCIYMKTLFIII